MYDFARDFYTLLKYILLSRRRQFALTLRESLQSPSHRTIKDLNMPMGSFVVIDSWKIISPLWIRAYHIICKQCCLRAAIQGLCGSVGKRDSIDQEPWSIPEMWPFWDQVRLMLSPFSIVRGEVFQQPADSLWFPRVTVKTLMLTATV